MKCRKLPSVNAHCHNLLFEQQFGTSNVLTKQSKQVPRHVELELCCTARRKFRIQNHAEDEEAINLFGNHSNGNVENIRRQFRF